MTYDIAELLMADMAHGLCQIAEATEAITDMGCLYCWRIFLLGKLRRW